MKNMLIIMPDLKSGGAEKSLVNFLNECDFNQYKIDLLLFSKDGVFTSQVPSNVNIIQQYILSKVFGGRNSRHDGGNENVLFCIYAYIIKIIGTLIGYIAGHGNEYISRQYRWNIVYRRFLPKLTKEYDIAMAYLEGEATYYLIDCVKSKAKFVWFHNDFSKRGYDPKLYRRFFETANRVISISEECVEILKKTFPGLENKFVYLENITSSHTVRNSADEFFPTEYSETHGLRILSIGRLNSQKGFDMAIDAAKILKEAGMKFCWYIIGMGELLQELETQVSNNEVQDNIRFLGIKTNPYPYIKNCDIFAQTSRYEGKSVVLDEAKILAKPILVTNYPTVKDQILENKEGVIVNQTPESIAVHIMELGNDTNRRDTLRDYLIRNDYGNTTKIARYYDVLEGRSID